MNAEDIKVGDWVEVTARVQVSKIERHRAPHEHSPTDLPFVSIEFIEGTYIPPAYSRNSDGVQEITWAEEAKPSVFTLELPTAPTGETDITIQKLSAA